MMRHGDSPTFPMIISNSDSEIDLTLETEEATASNTTSSTDSPVDNLCTQINRICTSAYPAGQLIQKYHRLNEAKHPLRQMITTEIKHIRHIYRMTHRSLCLNLAHMNISWNIPPRFAKTITTLKGAVVTARRRALIRDARQRYQGINPH